MSESHVVPVREQMDAFWYVISSTPWYFWPWYGVAALLLVSAVVLWFRDA